MDQWLKHMLPFQKMVLTFLNPHWSTQNHGIKLLPTPGIKLQRQGIKYLFLFFTGTIHMWTHTQGDRYTRM